MDIRIGCETLLHSPRAEDEHKPNRSPKTVEMKSFWNSNVRGTVIVELNK